VINNVVLVGRLTANPEMRYTPSGVAVTSFRLAVDRPRSSGDEGERQTDFLDIVTWRRQAELCGQYLSKGALVGLEGRIRTRQYTTQDGQQRRAWEVVAFRVSFLESRAERERRESRTGTGPAGAPPPVSPGGERPDIAAPGPEDFGPPDDDDPFTDQ